MGLLQKLKNITQTFKDGLNKTEVKKTIPSSSVDIEVFLHDLALQDLTLKMQKEFLDRGIKGESGKPRERITLSDLDKVFNTCENLNSRQKLVKVAAFARESLIKNTPTAYELIIQDLISSRDKRKSSKETYEMVLELRDSASKILNFLAGKDFEVYANFMQGLDDVSYKKRLSLHLLTLFQKNRSCAGAYLVWLQKYRNEVIEYWQKRGQKKSTDRPFLSMTMLMKSLADKNVYLTKYFEDSIPPDELIRILKEEESMSITGEHKKIEEDARVSGIRKMTYFKSQASIEKGASPETKSAPKLSKTKKESASTKLPKKGKTKPT